MLQRVGDILKFIVDFTEDVEGVGHVCRYVLLGHCQLHYLYLEVVTCHMDLFILLFFFFFFPGGCGTYGKLINVSFIPGSFSVFDFGNHGNKRYGSPFNSARDKRSSQGKMEKSFLRYD